MLLVGRPRYQTKQWGMPMLTEMRRASSAASREKRVEFRGCLLLFGGANSGPSAKRYCTMHLVPSSTIALSIHGSGAAMGSNAGNCSQLVTIAPIRVRWPISTCQRRAL